MIGDGESAALDDGSHVIFAIIAIGTEIPGAIILGIAIPHIYPWRRRQSDQVHPIGVVIGQLNRQVDQSAGSRGGKGQRVGASDGIAGSRSIANLTAYLVPSSGSAHMRIKPPKHSSEVLLSHAGMTIAEKRV